MDTFEQRTGWFVKRLGDGALLVNETDRADLHMTAPMALDTTYAFLLEWKKLIRMKHSPRPDGARAAGVYGPIWKELSPQFGYDYFGDKINLCEKMMRHHKGKCFLIHESLKELVTDAQRRRHGFSFTRTDPDRRVNTDPVYSDDLERLWWVVKRNKK